MLQGTGYDGTAKAQFPNLGLSTKLATGGSGFRASLEGGLPIPLPQLGPNFILEPQAQVVWQHVPAFDAANDGIGHRPASSSGTTGRLGVPAPSGRCSARTA